MKKVGVDVNEVNGDLLDGGGGGIFCALKLQADWLGRWVQMDGVKLQRLTDRDRCEELAKQLILTGADGAGIQLGAPLSPESEGSRNRPASGSWEIILFKQIKCKH